MGLIEEEIKELRRDIKAFRAGKLSNEDISALVSMYNQTEKRATLMLKVFALSERHGNRSMKRALDSNLLGSGVVIDLSLEEIEDEKILCPNTEKHIARHECLDISGSTDHFEACQGCEIGIENKNRLMGKPKYV